jgi:TonB family protein
MFNQLVESGSHRNDLARRGTFFAGTLVCYALLLVTSAVASVYTYNAQLDNQNLELVALVSPPPAADAPPRDAPRPTVPHSGGDVNIRRDFIARLDNNTTPPATISTRPNTVREMPDYGDVLRGDRDVDAVLPRVGTGGPEGVYAATDQPRVVVNEGDDIAPPVRPTPAPARPPERIRVSSQVLTGKVVSKPAPPYPVIARQAHVQGVVTVEILIDERGRVISAQATSGHPLLREAARQAALQAAFSPTQLNGQPVKVAGVITYNFVLQ